LISRQEERIPSGFSDFPIGFVVSQKEKQIPAGKQDFLTGMTLHGRFH
jgi:hypothetical protein